MNTDNYSKDITEWINVHFEIQKQKKSSMVYAPKVAPIATTNSSLGPIFQIFWNRYI